MSDVPVRTLCSGVSSASETLEQENVWSKKFVNKNRATSPYKRCTLPLRLSTVPACPSWTPSCGGAAPPPACTRRSLPPPAERPAQHPGQHLLPLVPGLLTLRAWTARSRLARASAVSLTNMRRSPGRIAPLACPANTIYPSKAGLVGAPGPGRPGRGRALRSQFRHGAPGPAVSHSFLCSE